MHKTAKKEVVLFFSLLTVVSANQAGLELPLRLKHQDDDGEGFGRDAGCFADGPGGSNQTVCPLCLFGMKNQLS